MAPAAAPVVCSVTVGEYNTVSVHAQNVAISTVLQELAIKSRKNIILAGGADRNVSMTLYSVPFYDALTVMLDMNGLCYTEANDFIQVMTREQMAKKVQGKNGMVSRVFHLSYLRPKDAQLAAQGLLSDKGRCKAIGDDDSDDDKDNDTNNGSGGNFSNNSDSSSSNQQTIGTDPAYRPDEQPFVFDTSLVVYDYLENVEAIACLLATLDSRPRQVLLEATVLEVTVTDANAFGVDFSILHDTELLNFFDVGGGIPVPKNKDAISRAGVISNLHSTRDGTQSSMRAGFAINDFAVFIQALDSITDVSVLSSPKVMSLDRQRARVLVGENVGYLETSFSDGQIVQSVEFIETGISLDVRPFIMDDDKIRLVIYPKVSSVTFTTQTIQQNVQQRIPTEDIQTVAADILVPQGATAVVGGLFVESNTINRSQMPVVGDIPILGTAARRQNDSTQKRELVFMIRPIIMSDNQLESIGRGTDCDMSCLLAGHRQGLLPWSRNRQCGPMNLKASRLIRRGRKHMGRWMYGRSLQLQHNQPSVEEQMRILAQEELRSAGRGILHDRIRQEIAGGSRSVRVLSVEEYEVDSAAPPELQQSMDLPSAHFRDPLAEMDPATAPPPLPADRNEGSVEP